MQDSSEEAFLQGLCYLSGLGVPSNKQEAYRLFECSKDLGNSKAWVLIGWMHYKKLLGPQYSVDIDHFFESHLSNKENAFAQIIFSSILSKKEYSYRIDGEVETISNEEINGCAAALDLMKQAAEDGWASGLYNLGVEYRNVSVQNKGIPGKEKQLMGLCLYQLAAMQGFPEAKKELISAAKQKGLYKSCQSLVLFAEYALYELSLYTNEEAAAREWFDKHPKEHLLAEYAQFETALHLHKDEIQALEYFNRHPKEHLVTYCNETVALLFPSGSDDIDEVDKSKRIEFLESYGSHLQDFDKSEACLLNDIKTLEQQYLFSLHRASVYSAFDDSQGQLTKGYFFITEHNLSLADEDYESAVNRRIQFINQHYLNSKSIFQSSASLFQSEALDQEHEYAVERLSAYSALSSREFKLALNSFERCKNSRHFTGEDAFHLAQLYLNMADSQRSLTLSLFTSEDIKNEKNDPEGFRYEADEHRHLAHEAMVIAADKGYELANDFLRSQEKFDQSKDLSGVSALTKTL